MKLIQIPDHDHGHVVLLELLGGHGRATPGLVHRLVLDPVFYRYILSRLTILPDWQGDGWCTGEGVYVDSPPSHSILTVFNDYILV